MNGPVQKIGTPKTGGTSAGAGGRPNTAPSCSPPKNQKRTAARLQATADRKNSRGCGKNDTNT